MSSPDPARGGGQARLMFSGTLFQATAHLANLVALFVVVTVLARELSLSELGAYGLLAPLEAYLLVVRNPVATSAIRFMAGATSDDERARTFSVAVAMSAATAAVTAVLIALVGCGLAYAVLDGELERQGIQGVLGSGAIAAFGLLVIVNLDALRAGLHFRQSAACEVAAAALYVLLMLALIRADASLWMLIAANGAPRVLSGALCATTIHALRLPYRFRRAMVTRDALVALLPTAGHLIVVEISNFIVYSLARPILGLHRSVATVGLFEGPMRAHNLFYAASNAQASTAVPAASRYLAADDRERVRQLVLRGSRYSLALLVPVCVTLMALGAPVLEVWLGEGFGRGGTALAILVSYWLLYGAVAANPYLLVSLGRGREVARYTALVAVCTLGLSLVLTPRLGIEGPAIAIAASYLAAFPLVLRTALATVDLRVAEWLRAAWLPAWSVGAAVAGALAVLRVLVPLDTLPAVLAAAGGGLLAGWVSYAVFWLQPAERRLLRSVLTGKAASG